MVLPELRATSSGMETSEMSLCGAKAGAVVVAQVVGVVAVGVKVVTMVVEAVVEVARGNPLPLPRLR